MIWSPGEVYLWTASAPLAHIWTRIIVGSLRGLLTWMSSVARAVLFSPTCLSVGPDATFPTRMTLLVSGYGRLFVLAGCWSLVVVCMFALSVWCCGVGVLVVGPMCRVS